MVVAINFTAGQVQYGYLVLATADVQINLKGVGACTIPAGAEVCLIWYRDATAGAQNVRGIQATTMLITGYYVQDQNTNDLLNRNHCTPVGEQGYSPRAFPTSTTQMFDADSMINWHNGAVRGLLTRACKAEGLPPWPRPHDGEAALLGVAMQRRAGNPGGVTGPGVQARHPPGEDGSLGSAQRVDRPEGVRIRARGRRVGRMSLPIPRGGAAHG
jgi:hypothetical protein